MTKHDLKAQAEKGRLPEGVQVIEPGDTGGSPHTNNSHADASYAGCCDGDPSDSDTSLMNAADKAGSLVPLQERPAESKHTITECFTDILNLSICNVKRRSDVLPYDNFASLTNVVIKERNADRKWDWLLFSIVIFAIASTFSLVWFKGLGILKLSEGDLKIYLVGWSSQMMALVIHRVRSLFKSNGKKDDK